ncbi:hypothetical protein N7492_003618 [Penicillium capsulatum]|uniref:Uncharacterized protein n=1 Tax=Penicillium capsulatum TaxID=69766 RepID=A0A9W9ILM0_9EURO|nr:hypothetical protein N7492_003618 [Penicillium capsulatum]KAJ6121799.1 hypothetical protein N7512_004264 [Penicillium capsulatum]
MESKDLFPEAEGLSATTRRFELDQESTAFQKPAVDATQTYEMDGESNVNRISNAVAKMPADSRS